MQRNLQALLGSADIHTLASVLKIVVPPLFLSELVRFPPAQCSAAVVQPGGGQRTPWSSQWGGSRVQSWNWQPGAHCLGMRRRPVSWGPVAHVITESNSH